MAPPRKTEDPGRVSSEAVAPGLVVRRPVEVLRFEIPIATRAKGAGDIVTPKAGNSPRFFVSDESPIRALTGSWQPAHVRENWGPIRFTSSFAQNCIIGSSIAECA